jgi:hypothetical protein
MELVLAAPAASAMPVVMGVRPVLAAAAASAMLVEAAGKAEQAARLAQV